MSMVITPWLGRKLFSLTVPTQEWARAVVLAMVDENRSFYMEAQPDGHWQFTVDMEHEEALRRYAA